MQTTKQPYELLIRWNQQGVLSGAHVQYRYVTTDNGAVFESVGAAEPLALDEFPLGDLLNQVQADALAEFNRVNAELNQAQADHAAAIDAANQRITELEAQNAAIQAPAE